MHRDPRRHPARPAPARTACAPAQAPEDVRDIRVIRTRCAIFLDYPFAERGTPRLPHAHLLRFSPACLPQSGGAHPTEECYAAHREALARWMARPQRWTDIACLPQLLHGALPAIVGYLPIRTGAPQPMHDAPTFFATQPRLPAAHTELICPHKRNRTRPATRGSRTLRRYRRRWIVEWINRPARKLPAPGCAL